MGFRLVVVLFAGLVLALSTAVPASAQAFNLSRPADGTFVVDNASLIDPADEKAINELSAASIHDHGVPIFVVTLPALSRHTAVTDIEGATRVLYDQWGIGDKELNGKPWNKGVLLLVSHSDRRARIQFGSGFGTSKDARAADVMQQMTTEFAAGNYSSALVQAAEDLAVIAHTDEQLRLVDYWPLAVAVLAFLALAATAISLFRNGKNGWGWAVIGLVVALLAMLWATNRNRSTDGFGASSDGFGGGDSGRGGGATGSW